MHRDIEAFDQAGYIAKRLPSGVLLTTAAGGRVNTMTIGWGTIGVEWGMPIFTAFVRRSRFSKTLLDRNPEFTVNVPMGESRRDVLSFCGRESGRDHDKIAEMGLTLVDGRKVSVPAIREFPLTLECRVRYSQEQVEGPIPEDIRARFYPAGPDGRPDTHTAYYAEIVDAYILE